MHSEEFLFYVKSDRVSLIHWNWFPVKYEYSVLDVEIISWNQLFTNELIWRNISFVRVNFHFTSLCCEQYNLSQKFPSNCFHEIFLSASQFHIFLHCIHSLFLFQDLTEENKILDRLVKRQSVTLNRLTSSHGELPNLIFAHSEELRVARHKMKQV